MKTTNEVVTAGVRAEMYARLALPRLLAMTPTQLRAEIAADPDAQTESMARLILDYVEEKAGSLRPADAFQLVSAAAAASGCAQPHTCCRLWKETANVQRDLGAFVAARESLDRAHAYALQTLAPWLHVGVVALGRAALARDLDRTAEARDCVLVAIAAFDGVGATDRADDAREILTAIEYTAGNYLLALNGYRAALRRAQKRTEQEQARVLGAVAACLMRLGAYDEATEQYGRALELQQRHGLSAMVARSMMGLARCAIAAHGMAGLSAMTDAKREFVRLGMAGEACRTSVAAMEELMRRGDDCDMSPFCRQIATDALSLGMQVVYADAIAKLRDAQSSKALTLEVLQEAWMALAEPVQPAA